MSYGTSVYATTAPAGRAPVDEGVGRKCEKCGAPVNRYRTRTKGFLLCGACIDAAYRSDMDVRQFVNPRAIRSRNHSRSLSGKASGRPSGLMLGNLIEVMETRGFNNLTLADSAGLSRNFVSELRTLRRGASQETAGKLADALGVSVEELTGEQLEKAGEA